MEVLWFLMEDAGRGGWVTSRNAWDWGPGVQRNIFLSMKTFWIVLT